MCGTVWLEMLYMLCGGQGPSGAWNAAYWWWCCVYRWNWRFQVDICISINTQFLLFIGKLQGGPNSYPLLVHLVYLSLFEYYNEMEPVTPVTSCDTIMLSSIIRPIYYKLVFIDTFWEMRVSGNKTRTLVTIKYLFSPI